ncbi:tetratricopeptide repeat protein [Roseofilum sp. BLCC_M154]|uniref:Tetratricopeptide repeat protein n=1 Tax=Roseofilum acuticapitatum BLCC-M154 TaxID=3022444 RepID=A0ABT7ASZ3_9CYAN|nr:tetratricopeptide repeat protein [Roseofilum acuticapitatum]MDJ1170028.1 tetratricopeptide repeat protein [Roseofilum acuticapitatum BLCC-M154]
MSTVALVTLAALIAPEFRSSSDLSQSPIQPIGDGETPQNLDVDPKFIQSIVQQVMPVALASISPPEVLAPVAQSRDEAFDRASLSQEDIQHLKTMIAQVVDTSMAQENLALVGGDDRLPEIEGTITVLNLLMVLIVSVPVMAVILFWFIRGWVVQDLVKMIHSQLEEFSDLDRELKDYQVRANDWMGELYRHLNLYKQHIRDELTTVHEQSQQSQISLEEIDKIKRQMMRQFQEMLGEAKAEKESLFREISQTRPSQMLEPLPVNLPSELPNFSPSQLNRTVISVASKAVNAVNPEELTMEDYLHQAQELTAVHRYEDAIAAYHKVLEWVPDSYETWLAIGKLYVKQQNYYRALEVYQKAINIDGNRDEGWYNLGNTLSKLENYPRALTAYDRALSLHPGRYEAWYNQGSVLAKLGRYTEAIDSYDRALILNPQSWEAWYHRGNLLGWIGEYEKAILSYDKSVNLNSQNSESWYKQGLALAQLGRHQEALAGYDIAVSLGKQGEGLWRNRGITLEGLNRYEEAIASYEQALAIQPEMIDLWLRIAHLLDQINRPEEALKIYNHVLLIQPNHPETLRLKGSILAELQQYPEAVDSFSQALKAQEQLKGNRLVEVSTQF